MRDEFHRIEATGATLLAVAPSSGDKADEFVAKAGDFPFPLLPDADHELFDRYDVTAKLMALGQRPAMFVIAADGTVVYNQIGKQQVDLPTVDEIVAELEALA